MLQNYNKKQKLATLYRKTGKSGTSFCNQGSPLRANISCQ